MYLTYNHNSQTVQETTLTYPGNEEYTQSEHTTVQGHIKRNTIYNVLHFKLK